MSMNPPNAGAEDMEGGWPEYRRLVMNGLDRIERRLDIHSERLGKIERNITMLNVKSGVWGAIAGAVAAGGAVLIAVATKLIGAG